MRLVLFCLWFFAMPGLAASGVEFWTHREGDSFYSSKSFKRSIDKLLKQVDGNLVKTSFDGILVSTEEKDLCSFEINNKLKSALAPYSKKEINFESVVYFLRQERKIDDVVVKLLLDADKVQATTLNKVEEEELGQVKDNEISREILNLITSFEKRFSNNKCLDDAYKNYHSEILKIQKNLKSTDIRAFNYHALKEKRISLETFEILEKARLNDLERVNFTLKSYYTKVKSLRRSFPVSPIEESSFVTSKVKKMALSRRQKLLQNYSDLQIMMMGDVIKKLRKRLETPKMEVLIYDVNPNGPTEVIEMTPMGRVRFLVNQVLKKDMEDLKLNKYFAGHQPEYLDLITASYEIGLIAGSEVDAIVSLEEMWNPKKTFWDKAGVWIQTFSSVATIVIPPPYGFIPALALVVIQATVGKEDPKTEGNYL